MGCCELHSSANYVLTPKSEVLYQSILLKNKNPGSPKKTVRFEISYSSLSDLQIPEETKTPWYESISSTVTFEWNLYRSNENVTLTYSATENKLHINLLLNLSVLANHEEIVCLINNPKYRMLWDSEVQKMELFFGDNNLDGSVLIVDANQRSRVFDRKVRTFEGAFYVVYVPYERSVRHEYMVVAVKGKDRVVVDWVEEMDDEWEIMMEKKFAWGVRLLDEIIVHKNN